MEDFDPKRWIAKRLAWELALSDLHEANGDPQGSVALARARRRKSSPDDATSVPRTPQPASAA
jgi:hypothetical protein